MYQYVLVCTKYIVVHTILLNGVQHFSHHDSWRVHLCTYWLVMSTYFKFLILLLCVSRAQPVCLPAMQAPAHPLNQITLHQVYSLLLSCTTVFQVATLGRRLGRVTSLSNLTATRDDALGILRVNTMKCLGSGRPPAPAIPRISS